MVSRTGSAETDICYNNESNGTTPIPNDDLVLASASRRDKFIQLFFGIGAEDKFTGNPKSNLILPISPFGVGWIFLTSFFLGYTALVTPPVIAFYWLDDPCKPLPTLFFDVIIDIFFLLDILISFNTGIYVAGEYVDDRWQVAMSYLKGFFLFDLVTSIPVSFVELAVVDACRAGAAVEGVQIESSELRIVRAVKPLRFAKIARILKIGKGGGVLASLLDYWDISPQFSKASLTLASLCLSLHIISCMWWLWKVLGFNENKDIVNEFLDGQPWGSVERADLSTTTGKVEAYAISFYLVTMTLTTVGYGDISAENTSERIGYVVLFVVGAFVWGGLLADVAEIHSASSLREKEKADKIQCTLEFLREHECPRNLRLKIIQWTRFHEDHQDENIVKKALINELPAKLQKDLTKHLYSREISRLPLFSFIESVDDTNEANDALQEAFLNQIFLQLKYATFTPGEVLVNFSEPADDVFIFISGQVLVEFEHPTIQRATMVLKQGDFIGDMALVGEMDWAKSTCFNFTPSEVDGEKEATEIKVSPYQDSYVVALTLSTESFQATLSSASQVTQAAVQDFLNQWKKKRELNADPKDAYKPEQLFWWENLVRIFKKKSCQEAAKQDHEAWKIAKLKKTEKSSSGIEQQLLESSITSDQNVQSLKQDIKQITRRLEEVMQSQQQLFDLLKSMSLDMEVKSVLPGTVSQ